MSFFRKSKGEDKLEKENTSFLEHMVRADVLLQQTLQEEQ